MNSTLCQERLHENGAFLGICPHAWVNSSVDQSTSFRNLKSRVQFSLYPILFRLLVFFLYYTGHSRKITLKAVNVFRIPPEFIDTVVVQSSVVSFLGILLL